MTDNRDTSMGELLLYLLGAALLIYNSVRTYDIMRQTLATDMLIFGVFGIAGIDGGLLGWSAYYRRGAKSGLQQNIALLMVILTLVGVAFTGIGDALLYSLQDWPFYVEYAIVFGVPTIIFSNIAAVVACHLADPKRRIDEAFRRMEEELQNQVARLMEENAGQTAQRVAQEIAQQRADELIARFRFSTDGHEREKIEQGE